MFDVKYTALLIFGYLLLSSPVMASSLEQQQQEFLGGSSLQKQQENFLQQPPASVYKPPVQQTYTPPVYKPPVQQTYTPPVYIPPEPPPSVAPSRSQVASLKQPPLPPARSYIPVAKSIRQIAYVPAIQHQQPDTRLFVPKSTSLKSSSVSPVIDKSKLAERSKGEKSPYTVVKVPSDFLLKPLVNHISHMIYPFESKAFITSLFGWRIHPISKRRLFHSGLDLGAEEGTPVRAVIGGKVIHADWMGGYGKTVIVESIGYRTLYGHLSSIDVPLGPVVQGTPIGKVGSTGLSTGPHLHFELQKKNGEIWNPIDPGKPMEIALQSLLQSANKKSGASTSVRSMYNFWRKIEEKNLSRAYPKTRE